MHASRGHRIVLPGLLALAAACDGGTAPLPPLDGRIEGSVRVEGQPLPGLQVSVRSAAPDGPVRVAVTDAAGDFALAGFDEGDYTVELGATPDHVDLAAATRAVVLGRDRPAVRVDFQGVLRRDAEVSVQVLVEGEGAEGVEVRLAGPETRAGLTDPQGRVLFERLLRGRYDVLLTGYDPERIAFSQQSATVEADGRTEAGIRFAGVRVPRIPSAPADFSATADGSDAVALVWSDTSDDETGFELQRRVGFTGDWVALVDPGPDAGAARDEGLTPATPYRYRLRACNEHGCSEPWLEASALTDDVPPAPPTDLSASASGPTRVTLWWTDASHNEDRFEVERRADAAGEWIARAEPGPGSAGWYDEGLTTGTTYEYRLRACNAAGCSPFVGPVSATPSLGPPAPPLGLAAVATAWDRISLSWTAGPAGETEVQVERRVGSGAWSPLATLAGQSASHLDTPVSGSTTYGYRLVSCNPAGCSDPGAEVSVQTPQAPPNLDVAAAYIVQRVQRVEGDVPLVAGLAGLLRVFPRANRSALPAVPVRVEFFSAGVPAGSVVVAPPMATMPTGIDESSLSGSWNVAVPAHLVAPGLSFRVVVDPDGAVPEADESDNVWPAPGATRAADVRTTPDFQVTFVPIRQNGSGQVGAVDAGNAADYLADSRRLMPFVGDDVFVHAEFATDQTLASDGTGWAALLSEVSALRATEGSSRSYYGVVKTAYTSGVAGIGYVGWPIALGWDRPGSRASVAAHEWGHNFGRPHSPGCGAGNADANYPHTQGRIGAWGLDLATGTLKSPATHFDFMTYCGPEWISDYVYERVLTFRGPAPAGPAPSPPAPVEGLLVWGRVSGGELILEPAFDVHAPVSLPSAPGRWTVEGRGDAGTVFSLSFDPVPVADGLPDEAHFAFVVPLSADDRAGLRRLSLSDGRRTAVRAEAPAPPALAAPPRETRVAAVDASTVEVSWDATSRPMALVKDAATGEVLAFARGGTIRLTRPAPELEIQLSDGVRTAETRRARWR